MARIEDIERRLLNWSRWKHGAGARGLGYARVNLAMVVVDGGQERDSIIPTDDCEAQDTDAAVMTLPSELRATVEVFYVHGGTMAAKAKILCCTEPTIRNRIGKAHPMIQTALADLAAKRRARRALVEAGQASARPKGSVSDETFVDQMKRIQARRGF